MVPTLLVCFLVIPFLYVLKNFILFATVMFEGKEKRREDYNFIHILYAGLYNYTSASPRSTCSNVYTT